MNIYILICACLINHTILAQTFTNITTYNTINSPIPSHYITSIDVDQSGNKWIGTDQGLVKFDGLNWVTYNSSNSGLYQDLIYNAQVDINGDIWVITDHDTWFRPDGSLHRFDGNNWIRYTTNNSGLPHNHVRGIKIDAQGNKWLTSDYGLVKYDGTTWTTFNTSNSNIPSNIINALEVDVNGEIWISTPNGGLTWFNGTNWITYNTSNSGINSNNVYYIKIDELGNKWLKTSANGVLHYDGVNWIEYNTNNSGIPYDNISVILFDHLKHKWIGTYGGGLTRFNDVNWRNFDPNNSLLPDDNIRALYKENNQTLWIGTFTQGLIKAELCMAEFLNQPTNQHVQIGDTVIFNVSVLDTNGLTFQWQVDDGNGFSNIVNLGQFEGVNDSVLFVNGVTNLNNNQLYRCIIQNDICSDTSTIALLTTYCIIITSQPQSVQVQAGHSAHFGVLSNDLNLTYQWQINTDTAFQDLVTSINYIGVNDSILSINNVPIQNNGHVFRCIVSRNVCADTTITSLLNVHCLTIGQHPQDELVKLGASAIFIIATNSNGVTFQWQINNGSGFTNVSNGGQFNGSNDSSLVISNIGILNNNQLFRCVMSTSYCSDTTNIAEIAVCPYFISQPQNVLSYLGQGASFNIALSDLLVNYQWQEDNGSGFIHLLENGQYSGTQTSVLSVSNLLPQNNQTLFRCIIQKSHCIDTSSVGIIELCPQISSNPQNVHTSVGQTVHYSINSSFLPVAYQWQLDSGLGFVDIINSGLYSGANSSNLIINAVLQSNDNNLFRCIISTANCSDTSLIANLSICPQIITQPQSLYSQIGQTISFTVGASDPMIQYQWQIDNGLGFQNISNAGQYSGVNSSMIQISGLLQSNNNQLYRCIIQKNQCMDTSLIAVLNICPYFTLHPISQSGQMGQSVTFSVNSSDPNALYQWQSDTTTGFFNLTDGGQFVGSTLSSLTVSNISSTNNSHLYRCILYNSDCSDTSSITVLNVLNMRLNADFNNLFDIYPNPFIDHVTISGLLFPCKIKVLDIMGKYLFETDYEGLNDLILSLPDDIGSEILIVQIYDTMNNYIVASKKIIRRY